MSAVYYQIRFDRPTRDSFHESVCCDITWWETCELVTWLISHTVPAIARSLYTSSLGFCLATLGLGIGIAVAAANSSTSSETGPETGSG